MTRRPPKSTLFPSPPLSQPRKEGAPACHDRRSPLQRTLAAQEDSVDSHVHRERLGIARGERLGKGALGFENLPGQCLSILRLGWDNVGPEEECEGHQGLAAHETVLKRRWGVSPCSAKAPCAQLALRVATWTWKPIRRFTPTADSRSKMSIRYRSTNGPNVGGRGFETEHDSVGEGAAGRVELETRLAHCAGAGDRARPT